MHGEQTSLGSTGIPTLDLWNSWCRVPERYLKKISAGKLKGKSDINPIWRYKELTQKFGPCGIGWKVVIVKLWQDELKSGEVIAHAEILLHYRDAATGEWSTGVPGIGGNMLVQFAKGNLVSNDDGYKSAVTDAISVAAKLMGIGAEVYEGLLESKYEHNALNEQADQNNLYQPYGNIYSGGPNNYTAHYSAPPPSPAPPVYMQQPPIDQLPEVHNTVKPELSPEDKSELNLVCNYMREIGYYRVEDFYESFSRFLGRPIIQITDIRPREVKDLKSGYSAYSALDATLKKTGTGSLVEGLPVINTLLQKNYKYVEEITPADVTLILGVKV